LTGLTGVAYGIFLIPQSTLRSWQLLFIFEGIATCCLALTAWFWLPTGPGTAWFLTRKERAFATHRMRLEDPGQGGLGTLTRRDIVETTRDWKLWFALAFNICVSVPASAFSVFLPLVVQGMGYRAIEANLVSHLEAGSESVPLPAVRCDRLSTANRCRSPQPCAAQ
jgi:hypothetical protein